MIACTPLYRPRCRSRSASSWKVLVKNPALTRTVKAPPCPRPRKQQKKKIKHTKISKRRRKKALRRKRKCPSCYPSASLLATARRPRDRPSKNHPRNRPNKNHPRDRQSSRPSKNLLRVLSKSKCHRSCASPSHGRSSRCPSRALRERRCQWGSKWRKWRSWQCILRSKESCSTTSSVAGTRAASASANSGTRWRCSRRWTSVAARPSSTKTGPLYV